MYYLNQCGIVCALGASRSEVRHNLFALERSGVQQTDRWSPGRQLALGAVAQDLKLPDLENRPLQQRSRNNQLALAALAQIRPEVDVAIAQFGAQRIGVVIGTSTSGIDSTEGAMRQYRQSGKLPPEFHYAQQELGSPAQLLSDELGLSGPAYVHSSACSSSGKAFASAARLIKMGLCDAVICGGVDTLCEFTVAGFSALESVSVERCNPLSVHRNGINIGEGAALFLMSKNRAEVALCGWGESSDGYHMSAPEPQGLGARMAIEQALQRAGIGAQQIDYINLHGTATVQNDAMEAKVIHDLFGTQVPVSSTKPFTGHALGAASAIEAALCWLTLQQANSDLRLPAHLWDGAADPALPVLHTVVSGYRHTRPLQWILSNSFAFGGSNAALVLGKMP